MTNLALLRARKGWTQGELAKRAGLSVRHVRYLEAGRKTPRLTTVVRLAQALGVPDTDLIKVFTARRRYAAVLMQQGRVQLDVDWNESLQGKRLKPIAKGVKRRRRR